MFWDSNARGAGDRGVGLAGTTWGDCRYCVIISPTLQAPTCPRFIKMSTQINTSKIQASHFPPLPPHSHHLIHKPYSIYYWVKKQQTQKHYHPTLNQYWSDRFFPVGFYILALSIVFAPCIIRFHLGCWWSVFYAEFLKLVCPCFL